MDAKTTGMAVGTVKLVIGEASVIGLDGTIRTLQVGDRVFANELVSTGSMSSVQIQFDNGTSFELGRDSQMALNEDIYGGGTGEMQQDAAAIQAAIAAGEDPTQVAPAAAAGPDAGAPSGGGHTFVVVDQANATGEVTPGFGTHPVSIAFPAPEFGPVAIVEAAPVVPTGVPTAGDGAGSVLEANLAGGSANTEGPATVAGTVLFSGGPDGLQSVTVDTSTLAHGTVQFNPATGAWTYTLSGPVTDGPGAETDTFHYTVTDTDGSHATGTVTITIVDDLPTAVADSGTATEGGTLTVAQAAGVLHNDTIGADVTGAVVGIAAGSTGTDATGGVGAAIAGAHGTLTLAADGSYSYVADASANAGVTDVFTYTMKDADGDFSHATLTITFAGDANVPTAGTVAVTVDDEGLSGGIPGGVGDVAGQATVQSGTLDFNFGGDLPGHIDFAAMAGATGVVGSETVHYSWDGTNDILTATGPRGDLFSVAVNPATGEYTVTLLDNVLHTSGANENDAMAALTYTVTDADGSHVNGTLNLTIDDDMPVLAVTNGIAQNSGATTLVGDLALMGADANGSHVSWTGSPPAGLTSNGIPVTYHIDGDTLTAVAGDATVFTLVGHSDGTYTFTQAQPLDLSVITSNLHSSVGAGGPQPSYYMYSDGTFGSVEGYGDWVVKISATGGGGGNANEVNPSTPGMGVGDNHFESGETMTFNFDNEGASSVNHGVQNLTYMTQIGVNGLGSGESLTWSAYFTDGTHLNNQPVVLDPVTQTFQITSPTGAYLNYVTLTPGACTDIRITSMTSYVIDDTHPKTLTFGFTAIDGDGDAVSSALNITVQNSHTLFGTEGNDALAGGSGADTLNGNGGNDILVGGDGNDVLVGGPGHDALTGGLGADTFKVTDLSPGGADTVADFHAGPGGDVLNLHDVLAANTGATLQLTESGGNTVVSVDLHNGAAAVPVLTLEGVTGVTLTQLLANSQVVT